MWLTAPTRAGRRVFLHRPAGSAVQYWRQVRATAGRWRFVSAQTGEALTAQINRRRVLQGKAAANAFLDNEVGDWKALTIRQGAAAVAHALRSQPGIISPTQTDSNGTERCADT
jgi:secreted PhoX family phosphatase